VPGIDTRTRFQGVFKRHQEGCVAETDRSKCNCKGKYWGSAWDREKGRTRKTERLSSARAAREARRELQKRVERGELPSGRGLTLRELRDRFLADVEEGVALNKRGRPYKPRSAEDLRQSLNHLPKDLLRRKADKIRNGQIQILVDRKGKQLSGSRVRSIVNAIRSMYGYGQLRELTGHDPAQRVRLPALNESSESRERIAQPAEFAALLQALRLPTPEENEMGKTRSAREALRDSIPHALAAYGTARRQEIKHLAWPDIDLELGVMELAVDPTARKSDSSRRVVPLVAPLWKLLREEWLAQGQPTEGAVVEPPRKRGKGKLSIERVGERIRDRWLALGKEPIGFQQCRHTAATWLDHAGVTPKVALQIMGHRTPEFQPGAARITLQRYTHVLPGELERAREQLDKFLIERSTSVCKEASGGNS
jgi:site-specific recombinase XerD